jgi:hypothetical protein
VEVQHQDRGTTIRPDEDAIGMLVILVLQNIRQQQLKFLQKNVATQGGMIVQ